MNNLSITFIYRNTLIGQRNLSPPGHPTLNFSVCPEQQAFSVDTIAICEMVGLDTSKHVNFRSFFKKGVLE